MTASWCQGIFSQKGAGNDSEYLSTATKYKDIETRRDDKTVTRKTKENAAIAKSIDVKNIR